VSRARPARHLPRGVKLAIWAAVGVVAVVFAVQGGEYTTLDLLRQRTETRALHATVDSLQRVVDSLGHYRDRVLHDTTLQERIGREEFGWVRGDKELLYRFGGADTSSR